MNELQKLLESSQGIETGIEALLKKQMENGSSMETAIEALIKQAKALKNEDDTEVAIKALIALSKKQHKETLAQMQRNDPPVESDFDMRLKGKGHIVIHGKDGEDGKDGEKGEQGVRGKQGEKGADGEKGKDGEAGAKGERGERGFKGDKGEQGEKGEQGDSVEITPKQIEEAAKLAKAKTIESLSALDIATKLNKNDKALISMKSIKGLDDALKRYAGYQGGGGSNYFLSLMDTIESYKDQAIGS